jgi:flagellar biosynthetic protein FliP
MTLKQVLHHLTVIVIVSIASAVVSCSVASAAPLTFPSLKIGVEGASQPGDVSATLQILLVLTILSLAPAILMLLTSFTRIVVVLSFIRNALSTQQIPPNQVLIGLALFLTFFVMAPVWSSVNQTALQPYLAGSIGQDVALARAEQPLREFMLRQTREKDLALFANLARVEVQSPEDVPTYALIPAFAISELKTAFQMGFVIFVPFIVIDMVVASTLMSMGMMMLPPMMISLPFKILLFVMVDGWHLITRSLVLSFK